MDFILDLRRHWGFRDVPETGGEAGVTERTRGSEGDGFGIRVCETKSLPYLSVLAFIVTNKSVKGLLLEVQLRSKMIVLGSTLHV